jgi:hypothetical protein
MITTLLHLLRLFPFLCGGHRQFALEKLALRQQLAVYKRTVSRPKLRRPDRFFWVCLSRVWKGWRAALVIVAPVLAHHRRRVVHVNVTKHPTAAWTAQQIVEVFPNDTAPSYLLRDREQVYGHSFRQRVTGMRIREVLTAAHSLWQNPVVERLIGSGRRECLDHVLVLNERHLRRILTRYFAYYHRGRPPLSVAGPARARAPRPRA